MPDIHAIFLDFPIHPRFAIGQENGYSVIFALMNPSSRGSIRLASADPEQAPIINPRYLTDPSDMAQLTVGLRAAREIGTAPAFAYVRDKELFPGSKIPKRRRMSRIPAQDGLHLLPSGWHMRDRNQREMRLSTLRFKVHGIRHLRMADTSVMPSIVSGNTNAAVLAIAERAASLLMAGQWTFGHVHDGCGNWRC